MESLKQRKSWSFQYAIYEFIPATENAVAGTVASMRATFMHAIDVHVTNCLYLYRVHSAVVPIRGWLMHGLTSIGSSTFPFPCGLALPREARDRCTSVSIMSVAFS